MNEPRYCMLSCMRVASFSVSTYIMNLLVSRVYIFVKYEYVRKGGFEWSLYYLRQ